MVTEIVSTISNGNWITSRLGTGIGLFALFLDGTAPSLEYGLLPC